MLQPGSKNVDLMITADDSFQQLEHKKQQNASQLG
jgi:hypothetical protein